MKNTGLSSSWKLAVSIVICEATGIISGLLSRPDMNLWFDSLRKPSWNPPSYLFGPVWTFLYLLMGIALWLVWKSNSTQKKTTAALILFALQLFFNFWWSVLFFKFHSPLWAFIDILAMVITIVITIFLFARISRTAAWLLVPYISWVCFATLLNYAILTMNR